MAKINLKLNAERVFGEFLPTVYLKIASVHNNESAVDAASIADVIVRAHLSLSFTKPSTMTTGEARNFIKENLDNLYLYTWISPYEALNSKLEMGNLKIVDLFNATKIMQDTTIDNFTLDSVFFPLVYNQAQISWTNGEYEFGLPLSDGKTVADVRASIEAECSSDLDGSKVNGLDLQAYLEYYQMGADADAMAGLCYVTYPNAIANHVEVGSLMDFGTVQNLFFFGPSMIGPWNQPDTITSIEANNRAAALMTQAKLVLNKISQDDLDAFSESSSAPDTAFESPAAFMDYVIRESMGIHGFDHTEGEHVTDGITTTNSFLYEHVHRFFTAEGGVDIGALSDFLNQYKKIKLTDLLTDEYGGSFNEIQQFDSQGRELLILDNIELDFVYDSSGLTDRSLAQSMLTSIEKLFFIGTVGLDMEYLQAGAFEGGESADLSDVTMNDRKIHRNLMNNYFGNITFEHVMKNNVVPNPYFTHFIYADDMSPYDEVPIQGLNGKLYAGEPYGANDLRATLNKLIKNYRTQSKGDRRLRNHLNNLRMIIEKYGHTPNFIRELKRYQVTFTDKQRRHKSGQFYGDFLDILVTVNKKIITQPQVLKRLSLNSTCIDMRPARPLGSVYIRPQPNLSPWYHVYFGTPGFSDDIDDYERYPTNMDSMLERSEWIPPKWAKLTRQIEYIDAGADGASYETAQVAEKILEKAREELSDITLTEAGVDEDYVESFVEAELEAVNDAYEALGTSIGADQICKNWGYFFFDYEKALYNTSMMANIINLRKMAVFFGISIPYSFFHVTYVKATRRDLRLDFASRAADSTMTESDFVKTVMLTKMNADNGVPEMHQTVHQVLLPSDMNIDQKPVYGKSTVNTVSGTDPDGTQDATKYSCVKYVHFGVPDNVSVETQLGGSFEGGDVQQESLHMQNDLASWSWRHGVRASSGMVNHVGIGSQLGFFGLKFYRMLAFELTDYMDDDVALAGTHEDAAQQFQSGIEYSGYDDLVTGGLGGDENGNDISQFNPNGDNGSWYEFEIGVQDTTLKFFRKIYNDFLKPFVDSFEEYVAYAEELCSYNKSTESFNDFFVDAMIEKYVTPSQGSLGTVAAETFLRQLQDAALGATAAALTGSESDMDTSGLSMAEYANLVPPWVAGALLSVFVKEIFFNDTSNNNLWAVLQEITTPLSEYDPDSGEAPSQEVIKMTREMYQLSPQKGNLEAVRTFKERIDPLLDILRLDNVDIKNNVSAITGVDVNDPDFATLVTNTPVNKKFFGTINIDSPIVPGMGTQGYYESTNLTSEAAGASSYSSNPSAFFYDELLNTSAGGTTSTGVTRPVITWGGTAPVVTTVTCIEPEPELPPTEYYEGTGETELVDTDGDGSPDAGSQSMDGDNDPTGGMAGGAGDVYFSGEVSRLGGLGSTGAGSGGSTGGGDAGGASGGSSCVLAGTLIETDRVRVPVEQITTDHMIYSYDFETNEYGYYSISSVMKPTERLRWATVTTHGGRTLRCTEEHPLYTLGRDNNELPVNESNLNDKVYVFVDARDLDYDVWANKDRLEEDSIKEIIYHEESVTVYNFEVEEIHSYISDNILSHNKTSGGSGGGSGAGGASGVGSSFRGSGLGSGGSIGAAGSLSWDD